MPVFNGDKKGKGKDKSVCKKEGLVETSIYWEDIVGKEHIRDMDRWKISNKDELVLATLVKDK